MALLPTPDHRLLVARHHFHMREARVERGFLEPLEVIGDGGLGVTLALDVGGAAAMLETPAAAIALFDVLEAEDGELHIAARSQHAAGFLEVRAELGLEQVREKRVGEDEVGRRRFEREVEAIGERSGRWLGLDDGRMVGRAVEGWSASGGWPRVVSAAERIDLVKKEVIAREVVSAPVEHLVVDVHTNVLAGEAAVMEEEIAEREGEATTATAKINDRGIKADKPALKGVEPERDGECSELGCVEQDAITHAHADAQVIGGQIAELAIRQAQHAIDQVQWPHERPHARERWDRGDEAAKGLVGEWHGEG